VLKIDQLDDHITVKKSAIEEEFEAARREKKEKKKNKKKNKEGDYRDYQYEDDQQVSDNDSHHNN
jgi:hypothetical protein